MTPSTKKKRLSRLKRATDEVLPGFRLTPRDMAILQAVYQYRAMITPQIEALFFTPSTHSQCLLRLKLLFHHGFLYRAEQPQILSEGSKPFVYWLDQRGAQVVATLHECELDELDWRAGEHNVRYPFLEHLLLSNDVRVALAIAAQQGNIIVANWRDERDLKRRQRDTTITLTGPQGGKQHAAVVADGYFILDTAERRYHQFLEIDRATVTGNATAWTKRDWGRKVAAYLEYYRSGKYQAQYHTQSLRVLTVTTGPKRLANLKAITEAVGGKSRFWFTTFKQVTAAKILTAPIWQMATKAGLHSLT
jgi:hypothetical protein